MQAEARIDLSLIARLTPWDVRAEQCKRRFFTFFCEFWETVEAVELIPNWHIEAICDELQDVYEIWARGESQDDVLINIPPGMSKSTIVTQIFPAWLWVRNASIRIISSSYAADLATAHAVKTRDILKSDKFNLFYPGLITFKTDSNGKTNYKNTKMGERFVTSTGSNVTGMHGDFIFNDDPINPEQATAEVELKKAVRFSGRTLSTRKTNKKRSVTIMIMQRLHDADPSGDWLKRKKSLRHICLPGRLSDNISPPEWADKYVNGLLDPVRLDEEALAIMAVDLGSYSFAGQVQQKTTPEAGGIWQRSYIIPIADDKLPDIKTLIKFGTDWDTAYTSEEENAASAWVTSGKTTENRMYIYDLGFAYLEFPELIKLMLTKPGPHYIEAKASGKSAKQTLSRKGIAAIEIKVDGGADKVARARSATPYAEAGNVYIKQSLYDLLFDDAEQGILNFPRNRKKDVADTLAQAIQRHFNKSTGTRFFGSIR